MPRVRFDHIAIAVERMAEAPAVLVGALGGIPDSGGPSDVFRWSCWRFRGGGRIEIIEPRGPDGFLHRFLARRGPGIHHVTFKVPSLREACDRAEAHGYRVVGYDDADPRWATAYLHPKDALGIVVQLAQSSGGDRRRPGEVPPGPANPPPAVTILGLRMRARSRERARVQWESILSGQPAGEAAGELVYRWRESPLRIAVEVDSARDEGPVAIEFASEHAIALPEDPHRRLGAVFVQRPRPEPGARADEKEDRHGGQGDQVRRRVEA